jgi:hypothetical protein
MEARGGYFPGEVTVIPGRGRLPASPESITTDRNCAVRIGSMDSGLAHERAPE